MSLQIQDIYLYFRNKNRINYFVKKKARWARAVDNSLESKNLNGFFKIYRVSKSSDNEFDENASCKQEKKTF